MSFLNLCPFRTLLPPFFKPKDSIRYSAFPPKFPNRVLNSLTRKFKEILYRQKEKILVIRTLTNSCLPLRDS